MPFKNFDNIGFLFKSQAVSDGLPDAQILDLSNRFYTLIPHDFGMKKPPLLNNLDYIQVRTRILYPTVLLSLIVNGSHNTHIIVQAKVQMLDNLLDIEVAYSLLRGGAQDNENDPIDINYEKLKTKIEVRRPDCVQDRVSVPSLSKSNVQNDDCVKRLFMENHIVSDVYYFTGC